MSSRVGAQSEIIIIIIIADVLSGVQQNPSSLSASPNNMTVLLPLDEFVPSAFTTTIHS